MFLLLFCEMFFITFSGIRGSHIRMRCWWRMEEKARQCNRWAWRSSWRLLGHLECQGRCRRAMPLTVVIQSVMETTLLWQGHWIRTVKAITEVDNRFAVLEKEKNADNTFKTRNVSKGTLYTWRKRKWFFKNEWQLFQERIS